MTAPQYVNASARAGSGLDSIRCQGGVMGKECIFPLRAWGLAGSSCGTPDLVPLRLARRGGIIQEHFEPGQCVFEQGDPGDRVYVIIKGSAEVVRMHDGTEQEQQVRVLTGGEYFGEMALMRRAPRSATVRCLEPMDVLSIEKTDFSALITHLDQMRSEFEQTADERTKADEAARDSKNRTASSEQ